MCFWLWPLLCCPCLFALFNPYPFLCWSMLLWLLPVCCVFPVLTRLLLLLSRALKTKGNTPKYGLIFHSSFIGRAKQRNKGRIRWVRGWADTWVCGLLSQHFLSGRTC